MSVERTAPAALREINRAMSEWSADHQFDPGPGQHLGQRRRRRSVADDQVDLLLAGAHHADLADADAVVKLAEDALSIKGHIDILLNNGGTIFRAPATDFPFDEWKNVLAVNIDSAFLLSQTIGKTMVEREQGKIINIASMLSYTGGITVPAYTASKHAIAGLTKALANEWGQYNVQVNAIAPGYIKTDNTQALQDDETRSAEICARIPANRWGESDDLAGAAVFLASAASNYVNGHILAVDGGFLAR